MSAECCVWVWADAVTVAFYGADRRRLWSRVFRGRDAVRRAVQDLAGCRTLEGADVRLFWREDAETPLPRAARSQAQAGG